MIIKKVGLNKSKKLQSNVEKSEPEVTCPVMDMVVFWYLGSSINDLMIQIFECKSRDGLKDIALSMASLPFDYKNNEGLKFAIRRMARIVIKCSNINITTKFFKVLSMMKNIGRKNGIRTPDTDDIVKDFFGHFATFVKNALKGRIDLTEKLNLLSIEVSEDEFMDVDVNIINSKLVKVKYYEDILKSTAFTHGRLETLYLICVDYQKSIESMSKSTSKLPLNSPPQ